jgi:hypothetical protein
MAPCRHVALRGGFVNAYEQSTNDLFYFGYHRSRTAILRLLIIVYPDILINKFNLFDLIPTLCYGFRKSHPEAYHGQETRSRGTRVFQGISDGKFDSNRCPVPVAD